ncbi:hypothetical protein Leryth_002384, partial [Lithospermum erythrorhizon]
MVTGDNVQTAKAIALECGILQSDSDPSEYNFIEGKTFRNLSETQRDEVCDKISVRYQKVDKSLILYLHFPCHPMFLWLQV